MNSQAQSSLIFQGRIIALWTSFLLGMLFHTQLALMPLFHGLDVAQSHTHEHLALPVVFWLMLGIFALPMFAIIATAFTTSRRYRQVHFGLTLVYTVSNLMHFVMDVFVKVPSYQLCLMAILFGIGVLLNWTSYQWVRQRKPYRQLAKGLS